MKFYLIENENKNAKLRKNGKYGWYYPKRKGGIQGIVIHTAEGAPAKNVAKYFTCLLYTSPSPRDRQKSRMPSSA